jgi:DNA replication protein DnaC
LRRYGLIVVDEVGYLPFEQDATNLFFQLVSSRYEHASLIPTSNLPFSGWGGVFGDQALQADCYVHSEHHPVSGGGLRRRDIVSSSHRWAQWTS